VRRRPSSSGDTSPARQPSVPPPSVSATRGSAIPHRDACCWPGASHQRAAPIPPPGQHRPHRPTSSAGATASYGGCPPPTAPRRGLGYWRHAPPPSPPRPRDPPADGVCVRGRCCQHQPRAAPVFGRCDRLAIQNRSARCCLPPCGNAHVRAEGRMDAYPGSIPLPAPNGMRHSLPRRHVIRTHPPGAPAAHDSEDGVQHLPVRMDAMPPSG